MPRCPVDGACTGVMVGPKGPGDLVSIECPNHGKRTDVPWEYAKLDADKAPAAPPAEVTSSG